MSAVPRRILLIQLHHLGDVVLTTPAIRACRAAFPDSRIDFLAGALGAQALAGNPHLDEILVEPALRAIRARAYDAVIDMHSVPRTALYTFASRAATRAGIRGRGPRNLAYTTLFEREDRAVYMARQKAQLLSALGVATANIDVRLEIAFGAAELQRAHEIVGGLQAPVVAISPVARHEFKQWGATRWAAVGDALAAAGASVIITSGPGEREQAQAVANAMTAPALWQYGSTTVRELGALYAQCVVWLGNDGGPKHIAAAAGTPTITVYRKQLGRVWSDEADPSQIALNSGEDSPAAVNVDSVVAAARRVLA